MSSLNCKASYKEKNPKQDKVYLNIFDFVYWFIRGKNDPKLLVI